MVRPENLHATLRFLGDVPDPQAPLLVERLRNAEFPVGYTLRIQRVGAFPDWKKLNVVWAGLNDPQGHLSNSYALTERILAEMGFPSEPKAFAPHVTIARKRSDRGKNAAKQLLNPLREQDFGEVTVQGPALFRSTLTPQGPIYENLGGAG